MTDKKVYFAESQGTYDMQPSQQHRKVRYKHRKKQCFVSVLYPVAVRGK